MRFAEGLALAFVSAIAINWAYSLQHAAVSGMPELSLRRPLHVVSSLLRNRLWFGSFGTESVGWLLYLAALRLSPLSLVQGVGASGIAALAIFSANGHPSRLTRREQIAVVTGVLGLLLLWQKDVEEATRQLELARKIPTTVAFAKSHKLFFNYCYNIGAPDCRLPTAGVAWHPTRPPVNLEQWHPGVGPAEPVAFTTVGTWQNNGNDMEIAGETYYWSKHMNFRKALEVAARVITSTYQEIEEQYGLYDCYQPDKMRVIPPGTDLEKFRPPDGSEAESAIAGELARFLKEPAKPMILALSRPDPRKNIIALIEAYHHSPRLQQMANHAVVAGNGDELRETAGGAQEGRPGGAGGGGGGGAGGARRCAPPESERRTRGG